MTKTILIVDDSKTIRDMLDFTLRDAGYQVVQANDGAEGMQKLAGNRFDVIITDINMPEVDGITFIRYVRADPGNKGIPVLVLTTDASAEMKARGREAGATGWIVKPFYPEKLIAVIRKVSP